MGNFRFAILAAAGIGLFVSAANAIPSAHLYITTANATSTGGTWQVYVDLSHDNDGLSAFAIDVLAGGGAQVTSTAKLMAAAPIDPSGQYIDGLGGTMGFSNATLFSHGTLSGGNLTAILAGQQTVYPGSDDPTRDMGVLVGMGQENASASPQNGSQGPIDGSGTPTGLSNSLWTYQPLANLPGGNGISYSIAGTLIEQGTYSTNGSLIANLTVQLDPSGAVLVLGTGDTIPPGGKHFPGIFPSGSNQPWGYDPYELGDSPQTTVTGDTISLVPEPASIGLIAILGTGLLVSGRRYRSRPAV